MVRVRPGSAVADQFVSSVTNGLTLLAAALLRADPGVLGEIAVVSAIVMLQIDVVRAWVVLPAQLAGRTSDRRKLVAHGAMAGAPIAFVAMLFGILVGSNALFVAALCLPGIAAFETLRSLWLGDGAAATALRWDAAWLAATSSLLLAVWLGPTMNAAMLTLAWLLPGSVLAVVAWTRQEHAAVEPSRRADASWRVRVSYAADTAIGQFSNLLPDRARRLHGLGRGGPLAGGASRVSPDRNRRQPAAGAGPADARRTWVRQVQLRDRPCQEGESLDTACNHCLLPGCDRAPAVSGSEPGLRDVVVSARCDGIHGGEHVDGDPDGVESQRGTGDCGEVAFARGIGCLGWPRSGCRARHSAGCASGRRGRSDYGRGVVGVQTRRASSTA